MVTMKAKLMIRKKGFGSIYLVLFKSNFSKTLYEVSLFASSLDFDSIITITTCSLREYCEDITWR